MGVPTELLLVRQRGAVRVEERHGGSNEEDGANHRACGVGFYGMLRARRLGMIWGRGSETGF